MDCVVSEIVIPTPGRVIGNSVGGGGSLKPKFLKKSIEQNWNFQRDGEGAQTKNSPWEGCEYEGM